jgi:uncharacterized protein involved in tolerance to divalent cations
VLWALLDENAGACARCCVGLRHGYFWRGAAKQLYEPSSSRPP